MVWNLPSPILVFLLISSFPLASILWIQYKARQIDEASVRSKWTILRRWIRIFLILVVPALLALSDFLRFEHYTFFACALASAVALVHFLCYNSDRTFIKSKWTLVDLVRLSFWHTISPTVALTFLAVGLDVISDHQLIGFAWLLVAGVVSRIGTIQLNYAEGLRLQKVKSGLAYRRAFALAAEMQIQLKRVYIVPSGRGHITNAFGGGHSVALTDNYGKFLHGTELDFVIAHELAHVKGRHGRKQLLSISVLYTIIGLFYFIAPQVSAPFRQFLEFVALLGPILAFYYHSRRDEYSADRVAVELTSDPHTAIDALGSLYRITFSACGLSGSFARCPKSKFPMLSATSNCTIVNQLRCRR
jgi:Zn-dependent protease with chaperone function